MPFSGQHVSRSCNAWCSAHLAWWVFKRCKSLYGTYVYRIQINFVEHTTITKKSSGWQKYDSPSYEKLPSGTHNTKKSLLTRGVRVLGEYSVGVAGQTVNLLPLWFGWFDSIFSHWSIRGWNLVGHIDAGWSIGNSRASLARNGGSIPPPAICQEKQGVPALTTWVGGLIPQVGSSGRYSSGKRLLLFLFTGFQFKKQVLNFLSVVWNLTQTLYLRVWP